MSIIVLKSVVLTKVDYENKYVARAYGSWVGWQREVDVVNKGAKPKTLVLRELYLDCCGRYTNLYMW